MTLRVVGAGLGRTGTYSLKLALERLLGGRFHHMAEVLADPERHLALRAPVLRGAAVDWEEVDHGSSPFRDVWRERFGFRARSAMGARAWCAWLRRPPGAAGRRAPDPPAGWLDNKGVIMVITTATVADAPALTVLWEQAGLRFDPALVAGELSSVLARDCLVLVDVDDAGELAGAVLGTFDGRRGWVNRLAVRQDRRGHGIATSLMTELERRLADAGCHKANLLIEPHNAAVASFYAARGYQADDLIFMQKWLAAPGSA